MIHFKDFREVLQILRDVYSYIVIQNKNDDLGKRILLRIDRILRDNDNTKQQGDTNGDIKSQEGSKES